jgi:hypothetical protein
MEGATGTAKVNLEERLHANIVAKLREWVASLPDPNQPLIGVAGGEPGSEMLTPRKILENVEQKNSQGEQFMLRWVDLMVNHLAKSKLF